MHCHVLIYIIAAMPVVTGGPPGLHTTHAGIYLVIVSLLGWGARGWVLEEVVTISLLPLVHLGVLLYVGTRGRGNVTLREGIIIGCVIIDIHLRVLMGEILVCECDRVRLLRQALLLIFPVSKTHCTNEYLDIWTFKEINNV